MSKWDHLVESTADERLRALERAYLTNRGDSESAKAYAAEALRRGKSESPVYFSALWDSGSTPKDDAIQRTGIYVSDALDNLMFKYSTKHNVDMDTAIDFVHSLADPDTERASWSYASRINLAIAAPRNFDRRHMRWVVKWLEGIVKNIKKLKLDTNTVKWFTGAVNSLKTLAGDE